MLDKIRQASNDINDLKKLRTVAKTTQQFRARFEQLDDPLQRLTPLMRVLAEFRKRGIPVDTSSFEKTAEKLAGHARKISQAFESDPSKILETDPSLRFQFWDEVKGRWIEDLGKTLLQAWKDHANAQLPMGRMDILDALDNIPDFRAKVAQIRQFTRQAGHLTLTLPTNARTFDDLQKLSETLASYWQQFDSSVIPDEVLNLLRKSADQGATLDELTPPVIQWLKENKLTHYMRVVLKAGTRRP